MGESVDHVAAKSRARKQNSARRPSVSIGGHFCASAFVSAFFLRHLEQKQPLIRSGRSTVGLLTGTETYSVESGLLIENPGRRQQRRRQRGASVKSQKSVTLAILAAVLATCGCTDSGVVYWKTESDQHDGKQNPVSREAIGEERGRVAAASISTPRDGEWTTDGIITVTGRVLERPPRTGLYILLRDRFGNCYLQWGPVVVDGERLIHRNVRLAGSETSFEILLVSCDREAQRELEQHARSGHWGAIAMPESGATVVDKVVVNYRPSGRASDR